MRIKEFFIKRYGPLKENDYHLSPNFNVFIGKNEDGKTLTIDALVKFLLGKNVKEKEFEKINRVEENPEGYVIVEDEKGKEIKLPEKGSLTKFIDLSPSAFRNIFIIRNSDLSISSPEEEFYTSVTDKLTGLRTNQISKIKGKLQEIGKLTRPESGAELSNKQDFGQIRSRLEYSEKLIKRIEELQNKAVDEGFDKMEEEIVYINEKIKKLSLQLDELENARTREKFEKGSRALSILIKARSEIKKLDAYNEKDEQLWRDCERDIKRLGEEKEGAIEKLKNAQKALKEVISKLKKEEREFLILTERKRKLDADIKPALSNYEERRKELAQKKVSSKYYAYIGNLSFVLFAISSLGAIFVPNLRTLFGMLSCLFSISTIIFYGLRFSLIREDAKLAGFFEELRLNLSRFELAEENPKEILSNIQRFEEDYQKNDMAVQDLKREKEIREAKIKEIQNTIIPGIEKKINEAMDKIDEIKTKSMVGSLQDYTKKLRLKNQYENSINEQRGILENILGVSGETTEMIILNTNKKLKEIEKFKSTAKNIAFDEENFSRLKEDKDILEEKLDELRNKTEEFKSRLAEIEREANKILQLEGDYLPCETSRDLNAIKERLTEFMTKIENTKSNVLDTLRIFEVIEKEEKERVSELFGDSSNVSRLFRKITAGLYKGVFFNQELGKVEVLRSDGVPLDADKLSGGAYDQLYLSVRLSLAEKLLKDRSGFFIMDDPFVKADPDRLKIQMNLIKKISKSGWQILYFSAKGEVRDTLKEDIKKGDVTLLETQGIALNF